MCGIAGLISRNGMPVDRHVMETMTDLVSHRGPDGVGYFFHGSIALGHRRLSILDLSEHGAQPMKCRHSNRIITYNGEIYNFLELRQLLEKAGYLFNSNSDTEVILSAYDHWGPSCVNQFNGMWAFAIYDPAANIIFCSRDRFGVKPFYYTLSATFFAFGSEIRQLLKFVPQVQANRTVLIDYLFTGALEYEDDTFFEGIKKLRAGHNLLYKLDSHHCLFERYYELKLRDDLEGLSIQDSIAMYRDCLSNAVKLRLRSDVPVGTCLSGGLDSSSVATLASTFYSRSSPLRFKAITAVSEDPANDESQFAKLVVDRAGLSWLTVKPSYEDFDATIMDVALAQEEPFGNPSVCMQYFVMRTARENGLSVLLDGQGGDETMLGYHRYFVPYFLNVWAQDGLVKMVKEMRAGIKSNALMRPKRMLSYLLYFSNAQFRFWNYRYRNRYLIKKPPMPPHVTRYAKASRNINALQTLEIEQTNLPHLLRFEDKNSMWNSVETRLPFLDYRHVELALSLPWHTKIHNGWTKYLLREAMSNILPEQITWRQDKKGFDAPTKIWLCRHEKKMQNAVLVSSILSNIGDLKKLRQDFLCLDAQTRWRLYSVAIWERLFGVSSIS